MNLKNVGELVHESGMLLSTMSSDTASLMSTMSLFDNGGRRYRLTPVCAVLSTTVVVVVAVVPVSDVFALHPDEKNARNSFTLVRLDSNLKVIRLYESVLHFLLS